MSPCPFCIGSAGHKVVLVTKVLPGVNLCGEMAGGGGVGNDLIIIMQRSGLRLILST